MLDTLHADRNASRQREQLRRLLYPSITSKDDLPLLLPLTAAQQDDAKWIEVDFQVQLILAQILRIAVLPWYSKLTNDKDFYEEVIKVIKYSLQQAKEDLLSPCEGGLTRLERFTLLEIPSLIQLHYSEVHRAIQRSAYNDISATSFYLISNPHPALAIVDDQIQIDEQYIDIILLAILQRLLPKEHWNAQTETLIIIDVIKGLTRAQLRIRGNGAWAFVRLFSTFLDDSILPAITSKGINNESSDGTEWYARSRLLFGLNFVFAVLKTLFLYIATFYLELFSPVVEPKRRSKRRKRDVRSSAAQRWNLMPTIDAISAILSWKDRFLTRLIGEWLRMMLIWGGDWLMERLAKEYLRDAMQPDKVSSHLQHLLSILPTIPNLPPPPAATPPSIKEQRVEYRALIDKLLLIVQSKPAAALLLGTDHAMQAKAIEDAISPILTPPANSTSSSSSLNQIANARTLVVLLERIALLLNPSLEA